MFSPVTLCVTACLAQGDRGTLTGIVTDNSGAVVTVVTINVTNTLNNSIYRAASTAAGAYTVPKPTGGDLQTRVCGSRFQEGGAQQYPAYAGPGPPNRYHPGGRRG